MSYVTNGKQQISAGKERNKEISHPEPPPIEKLNWLIHLQHIRGEINTCKQLIKNEINKSSGKSEYVFFKQGIMLREEGKIQEALESFQICLKLNGENTDNVKEVANCLYLLRRYRLALEAYLEAERTNKPDWEIYHNVGQCLMRLGDMEKAKDYVSRAVQLGKQECSYDLLIKILIAENDFKSAITVCNAATENCPDSVNMLTEMGLLYLKSGQTQHAFERLSSALALEPQCSKALLGVGCITQTHKEYDVALSKYKVALQTNQNSVALWNNIGMCFYSKQKYIAAVSCLKRALWLSPLNPKVLFNLGLVHLATYQPASAFNFLCAAVNLRPDMGLAFMLLGCALLELQDAENALRAFKQSIILLPNDPTTVLNTCVCLLKCELNKEAFDVLQRFKSIAEQDTTISKEVLDLEIQLESLLMSENYTSQVEQKTFNTTKQNEEDKLKEVKADITEEEASVVHSDGNNTETDELPQNNSYSRNVLSRELDSDEV